MTITTASLENTERRDHGSQSTRTVVHLKQPYLLFLGEETVELKAKTAYGLHDWTPENCCGQWRMPNGGIDLGLSEMTPERAVRTGVRSMVIGVTPPEGRIPLSWAEALVRAACAGLDLVSGLHTPLDVVPGLAVAAKTHGSRLIDVRRPPANIPRATGRRRSGKRLLTVGTDCALGKKYTALAIARALNESGTDADFRASGQTGIMIAGSGIAMDAVVSDFVAGAAECISPAAPPDHWDVIEGQGAIMHPAYAAVTLGLLYGSQPDGLVLCHDPQRQHIVSWPHFPITDLREIADLYLRLAHVTNPDAYLAGISLNTSALGWEQAMEVMEATSLSLGVPCFDPMRSSLQPVVERLLA